VQLQQRHLLLLRDSVHDPFSLEDNVKARLAYLLMVNVGCDYYVRMYMLMCSSRVLTSGNSESL
jgi:hypothetical protein